MSYTIVYNRQFLRIDDKIIPLVLCGSNNCYEMTWSGRERRERDWSPLYFGRNSEIAISEEKLMERVRSCCGGDYQEHFMRNGKWVDDAGLIRFVQNGIKNAKTIEELQEEYYFSSLSGWFSVWGQDGHSVENRVEIASSEDLRQFLTDSKGRLDSKTKGEEIYICLSYSCDKLTPKVRKEKTVKERLTDYYAIRINDVGYLTKVTRRRIFYGCLCRDTKQFKSEKEANRYITRLKERFSVECCVSHIVDGKSSKWNEIRSGFYNESEDMVYIDAWKTKNDNEEGRVIAKVCGSTKVVEYLDEDAKRDLYVQSVIQRVLAELEGSDGADRAM